MSNEPKNTSRNATRRQHSFQDNPRKAIRHRVNMDDYVDAHVIKTVPSGTDGNRPASRRGSSTRNQTVSTRTDTHSKTVSSSGAYRRGPSTVSLAGGASRRREQARKPISTQRRRAESRRQEKLNKKRQDRLRRITAVMLLAAVILMGYSILSFSGIVRPGAIQMAGLPELSFYYEYKGDATSGDRAPVHVDSQYDWLNMDSFAELDDEGKIDLIGAIAAEDQSRSGVLASITAAQLILESGVMNGGSELAANHNNYFGIKGDPNDSETWRGSTWDGSTALYNTAEQDAETGEIYYIDDYFRVYDNLIASVADHSAYLANATWDGTEEIYPGIEDIKDYREAAVLIAQSYATDLEYANNLIDIIEQYNLDRFDA
jgi:flagellum-specific peptidoglycan hydrolase FlgJ